MSLESYAVIGLTAIVAALVAVVVYAMLRFSAAVSEARSFARPAQSESAFMAREVQEAVSRLRSQERESQARAEASERLSEEIVASLTSGLLLVGVGGRIGVINPAGVRLLGLPATVQGSDYREALAGIPSLRDLIAESLQTGTPVLRRTLKVKAAEGRVTHLGVTVSPGADESGRLQSVICLFADLSKVMELEEQIRLRDSLARLGELTAGMAHEFRNGLATIHGYARLIDPAALSSRDATYVEGIRRETESLGEIVSNFLSFARPAPLSLARVNLAAIVDRVIDEARAEVEGQGGRLLVTGEFPTIEGDEILLRQALSNLCRNAVEACRAQAHPPEVVVTGDVPDDGWCRLVVADNGPGIDPAGLDRIFQPFVTTKIQGTGLGLALVQKIVVTHNGRVAAANRPEGGAAFEVVLPLVQTSSSF